MFEFCSVAFDSHPAPSIGQLLACGPLREALLRGAITGILGLAGLFNLILLFANPRNISHLIFSAFSLTATVSVVLPYFLAEAGPGLRDRIEFQIFEVLLPALLFIFVFVLFPALRRRRSALYRLAAGAGFYAVLPAALGLIAGGLVSDGPGPDALLRKLASFYGAAALAATGGILFVAVVERQQGAQVASTGFVLFVFGMSAGSLMPAHGNFAGTQAGSENVVPKIAGALAFVLSMVFLMGPNRYQMHRQLRRSRNVLREANRKLRELDALKNRYIASSARELQSPLEAMLDQCLRLVEDPAYRLSPSQLSALSAVMDMARKMIVRNERAAVLFAHDEIRARDFDVVKFLKLLVVMLEEQLPALRFSLSFDPVRPADGAGELRVFADPTLIETAFIELAENAASHGQARDIRIRVGGPRTRPGAALASADRIELAFIEPAAERSAARLRELSGEFQQEPAGAPGVGLGLSLVRRIAENHGSRLEIQESFAEHAGGGRGVEFRFSVPRAGARGMRPPEVEWGLKHLRFLLSQDRRAQAGREARRLAARFPEARAEALQCLEDTRP